MLHHILELVPSKIRWFQGQALKKFLDLRHVAPLGFSATNFSCNLAPNASEFRTRFSTETLDTHDRINLKGKSPPASCPNLPDRTWIQPKPKGEPHGEIERTPKRLSHSPAWN